LPSTDSSISIRPLDPGDPALQGRVEPKQPRVPAPTIDRPVQDLTGVAIANLEHPPE
jgi:hypothetical protein